MAADAVVARRYFVRGRVQGVGFRFFVEHTARELRLGGYVKNRADGSVEVYACGASSELDRLTQALWSGPRWASVEQVEEREADFRPETTFRVEY
jgi:acylphosphatase